MTVPLYTKYQFSIRWKWVDYLQMFFFCLERINSPGSTEDLRADIESLTVTLLRRKQDLYWQHGLFPNDII